jgi:hypothetical protein
MGSFPLATSPATLATLAASCQLPITRKLIARRLGEDIEKNPAALSDLLKLTASRPESFQSDILAGLSEALRGWSKAKKPPAWDALQAKLSAPSTAPLRERVRYLSALFGYGRALDDVKRVALDSKAELAFRQSALQTLIEQRPPDLRQICEKLLNVSFLNSTAARGLRCSTIRRLAKLAISYLKFHPSERQRDDTLGAPGVRRAAARRNG